jgi:4-alpha-glucanotransferase
LVPLFSLRSGRNHGIGDIRDLYSFVDWAQAQRLSFIQLLPLSPLSPKAPFPYSAYSAFGLDLSVIALDDVADLRNSKSAQDLLLSFKEQGTLKTLRDAERLDYAAVDSVKRPILKEAFRQFKARGGRRRTLFESFQEKEHAWLEDFSLFSAMKEHFGWENTWQQWAAPLRDHEGAALNEFKAQYAANVEFYAYVQWIADQQWGALQTYARNCGVSILGDLPIYVGGDSADVWARRELFDLEAHGGAPPDYFNWLGQNWSSPLYNWDRMREDGYGWWKDRVRYHARCFDGLRFDHFRGVSEYWRIPKKPAVLGEIEHETEIPRASKEYQKVCWFWPIKFQFQFRERMSEEDWKRLSEGQRLGVLQQIGAEWVHGPGESFMRAMLEVSTGERGTLWVVEDLGADMEAVYELRDRLGLAGMRVVQFFGYDDKGRANPHVDPARYPENALAMTDTHDLPPLRVWLDSLSGEARNSIAAVYAMSSGSGGISPEEFERGLFDRLLACPSRWVLFSLQTILGLGEGHRVNLPGTVGNQNWTWRTPCTLKGLPAVPWLSELILKSNRSEGR